MALKQKADKPTKMKRKAYERELQALQVMLCHLQDWVKEAGARIIILFEGRDAAGKGGTIKALTERVSPRVFRVVALPAPSDRERTQMFGQRYIQRFPAAGEIIIFDRSWYNRAGVEYVMGFCSEEEHRVFLQVIPQIEKYVVDAGMTKDAMWKRNGEPTQYGTRMDALHLGLTVRRQGNKLVLRERYNTKRKIGAFRSWAAVERA